MYHHEKHVQYAASTHKGNAFSKHTQNPLLKGIKNTYNLGSRIAYRMLLSKFEGNRQNNATAVI